MRAARAKAAQAACAYLSYNTNLNLVVFSPIAKWAPIAEQFDLPHGFDHWQKQDFFLIRKSKVLLVLAIDGMKNSSGLQHEIEFAQEIGREILLLRSDISTKNIWIEDWSEYSSDMKREVPLTDPFDFYDIVKSHLRFDGGQAAPTRNHLEI